jgi:DNA-binding HxlR family transcriptional regulator
MRSRGSLRADAGRLAGLFHHGWSAAVLADIHLAGGAKVVTLVARLGAPRDSVRRTLEALARRRLVRRNPGYGHPMRPEWVLTEAGRRLGPACDAFVRGVRRAGAESLSRRKWAVPVLLGLLRGSERFSELGAALPRVTARALAITLRDLEAAGLVERRVLEGRPPCVRYGVGTRARPLARVVRDLAAAVEPRLPREDR